MTWGAKKYASISTHAPRTGSDIAGVRKCSAKNAFQPTLPARGATYTTSENDILRFHFNPRSPHGERQARP